MRYITMKSRTFNLAILFAGLIFIHSLASEARAAAVLPMPELSPLPLSEQLSTMREPLPVEVIVDASLEFSGASETGAAEVKDKLVVLLRKFRDEVANVSGQAELGEKALAFLHKNLLSTYSLMQTRVDTAVDTGVYNCVSSAVLYMIFARSVGLSVSGARTPDHAFCVVLANGQQIDVETTNPYGFNPGSRKEFSDSFGKLTGFSYVPPGNYRDRRGIGEKEMLGLILYDRVSEYGEARLYRDALQPAVSAYALMGTPETLSVLKIALSNYVTSLGMRQDFPGAIQFLDAVKASFGGIVDLGDSRRDIYHNWTVNLIHANDLANADALLSQPATKASVDDADWMNLSVEIVLRRAQGEAAANGNLPAAAVVTDGIKRLGRQPPLLQTYQAYIHNAFALLYNGRKLAEAKALIEQGLAASPDSAMLQQDLDIVKKAMKRQPSP
jgi:hypothetical protein